MLVAIAKDHVRMYVKRRAQSVHTALAHGPRFRPWVAAVLPLESEPVECGLGDLQIALQVGDRQIDDAFPAAFGHRCAADVVHVQARLLVFNGLNEQRGDFGPARVVGAKGRRLGFVALDAKCAHAGFLGSRCFCTFPSALRGSFSTITNERGILNDASFSRQQASSCVASRARSATM